MSADVDRRRRPGGSTRIMVFTGTRADFGLLRPIIAALDRTARFDVVLVAGGSHFSTRHGRTLDEITDAGFEVDWRIDVDVSADDDAHIARVTADTLASAADAIDALTPDVAIVLGDRYEALAFATACLLSRVPIAHIHGGEITEGAVDDAIRNSITQMATFHFVAAPPFADRVATMVGSNEHVHVVGAPGLDSVKTIMSELDDPRSIVQDVVGPIDGSGPLFLVTYHPETRSADDQSVVMQNILNTLLAIDDSTVLISAPNADWGRNVIAATIDRTAALHPRRVRVVPSLGQRAYVAAMVTADAVVGNSSSGVIEAPFAGVPTVNVGERQLGRPMASTVFQSTSEPSDLARAVADALAAERVRPASATAYGTGDASARIVGRLLEYFEP